MEVVEHLRIPCEGTCVLLPHWLRHIMNYSGFEIPFCMRKWRMRGASSLMGFSWKGVNSGFEGFIELPIIMQECVSQCIYTLFALLLSTTFSKPLTGFVTG